jgi:hypothetical protein
MCAILFGAEFMEKNVVVTGNANCNSPLVWDEMMLGAIRASCRRNQPILCSPFVLGGANTPASTAPAVAQLNAECAFGARLHAGGAQGLPGHLRSLPLNGVDGFRRPDGGHARNLAHELHDRADGTPLQCALAHLEYASVARKFSTPGPATRALQP